jgi:predicted solute-binding protein
MVVDRKSYAAYALDRLNVPPDALTAAAILNLAVDMLHMQDMHYTQIVKYLRQCAENVRLVNEGHKGKLNG